MERRSRNTKFTQVRDDLLERIRRGVYPVGAALPGRQALMSEYGVAYGTLDRAIRRLSDLGVVHTVNGRGSFVVEAQPVAAAAVAATVSAPVTINPLGIGRLKAPAVLGVITVSAVEPTVASYGAITRAIEAAFSNAGGTLWTLDRWRPGETEAMPIDRALRTLRDGGVSALIVVGILGPIGHGDRILENIDLRRTPAVFVTSDVPEAALPHVYYDNMNAGFVAAEHLIRRGYRRLFFLTCGPDDETAARRIRGARQAALTARGEGVTFEVVRADAAAHGGPRPAVGHELAAACLAGRRARTGNAPVAFIGYNDAVAMGAMERARERGLEPGRDIGVIGFDDNVADRDQGLSSVRPALEEMGQNAARMVIDMLNGDPAHFQVCCASQVIARRSTNRTGAFGGERSGAGILPAAGREKKRATGGTPAPRGSGCDSASSAWGATATPKHGPVPMAAPRTSASASSRASPPSAMISMSSTAACAAWRRSAWSIARSAAPPPTDAASDRVAPGPARKEAL